MLRICVEHTSTSCHENQPWHVAEDTEIDFGHVRMWICTGFYWHCARLPGSVACGLYCMWRVLCMYSVMVMVFVWSKYGVNS